MTIRLAFEPKTVGIPLDQIVPSRKPKAGLHATTKFRSILSSIREVGIIEPLAVYPQKAAGSVPSYLLLDGHLRLEVLRHLGAEVALCLMATDDENFTYNRQVNRLSTVQEHFMIRRAIERGVSAEKIAAALSIDVNMIRQRHRLLENIAPEVVSLLKNKHISRGVFAILRRMKPLRQIEAAEMMVSANLYTKPYADMLLAATRPELLIDGDKTRNSTISREDIVRMERELEKVNQDHKVAEETLGENMLTLVVAKGYVSRLLHNKAVGDYLKRHHSELSTELKEVIDAISADARSTERE